MENMPSYFSIIPATVRYSKDLSPNEKLMYSEITALSNKYGYCKALNNYFAELYGVSVKTVSKWISNLEKHGFIEREVLRDQSNQVIGRKLYPVFDQGGLPSKKSRPSTRKGGDPLHEKAEDNNTSMNNTSMNSNNICASGDAGVSEKVDKSKKTKEKDIQIAKDFEEIWAVYPRKIGKKEALRHYKAWVKKSKANTKEVMLEKVKTFAKYVLLKGTAKDYIPYGSTWFSSRVDDDYSADAEQGQQPSSGGYDNANSLLNNLDDDDLPF